MAISLEESARCGPNTSSICLEGSVSFTFFKVMSSPRDSRVAESLSMPLRCIPMCRLSIAHCNLLERVRSTKTGSMNWRLLDDDRACSCPHAFDIHPSKSPPRRHPCSCPLDSPQVWGIDVCCALIHRFGRKRAATAAAVAQGASSTPTNVAAKVLAPHGFKFNMAHA